MSDSLAREMYKQQVPFDIDARLSVDEELLATAALCIGRRFGLLRFVE